MEKNHEEMDRSGTVTSSYSVIIALVVIPAWATGGKAEVP